MRSTHISEIGLMLFQVAYNSYAIMKIEHLLEILAASLEKEMHVGKIFEITRLF